MHQTNIRIKYFTKEDTAMYKFIVALALTIGPLVAVACGSSETAAPAAPAPTTAPAVAPVPTTPPQAAAVDVKVGTGVGDRVPEFEISLTDGTLVSAAELQESQRPAFLFFFSTT